MNHRRSIRLKDYDYSREGAYFITICTHRKKSMFGKIVNGEMQSNDIGIMIEKWWRKLPEKFANVVLDKYIIMPNHVHGIIVLVGADPCVGPNKGAHTGAPLPRIIQWFKTMSTNEYIRYLKMHNCVVRPLKLWQRNYYEHIIRDENDLKETREYIAYNALKWNKDEYYNI